MPELSSYSLSVIKLRFCQSTAAFGDIFSRAFQRRIARRKVRNAIGVELIIEIETHGKGQTLRLRHHIPPPSIDIEKSRKLSDTFTGMLTLVY